MANTLPWAEKVRLLRATTVAAAPAIPDGSVDFVYHDARHDFPSVLHDLELYWPKLRAGGVYAGHDFEDADEAPAEALDDWAVGPDGARVGT